MPKLCPCTSGLPYSTCCAPLHEGESEAATPEALMRSRFAAFARADAEYLWRTLHPDHEDRALPREQIVQALKERARALKFMRLSILDAKDELVLFHAAVFEKGKDRSFVELSRFSRDGAAWRYLSGEARGCGAAAEPAATIETFHRR